MRANPIITNFTAGEISPRLKGRVDVSKYYNGCQTLENFIVMPHGGIDRRPGIYYVATGKTSGKKVRLVPFEFSTTQAYILEFGHNYIRVYKDRGQVINGTPVEVVTTYTEAELFELQFAQSADTLYIAHPSHPPATLTRSSHISWTLADISFTPASFNAANQYPACVAFMEQRLCWAATNDRPQTLWASVSGDYDNLTTGTDDDDAFEYTLASDRVNRIRWMVPANYLFLGTVGGEFKFGGASVDSPVTPSSVNAKRQSTYGSKNVQAILAGNAVLFLQRSGKKVRELAYDFETDSYKSKDATILAEHVTKTSDPTDTGLTCLSHQQDPDSIVWGIREDGQLLGMTYEREQQVVGWHRHTVTGGLFESVAVIPGVSEDEVWVSVAIGNDRLIGYMKPRDFGHQRDAFFVDMGVTYDGGAAVTVTGATNANPIVISAVNSFSNGNKVRFQNIQGMTELNGNVYTVANRAAGSFELSGVDGTSYGEWVAPGAEDDTPEVEKVANSFTGLAHLPSQDVRAFGDGGDIGNVTVDGAGAFSTTSYYNTLHAGLGYTSTLLPMEIEAGATLGTAQGETKRIHGLAAKVYNSLPFQQGPSLDDLKDIPFEVNSELFTGDLFIEFEGDYGYVANVYIVQALTNPLTILSLMPKMETIE